MNNLLPLLAFATALPLTTLAQSAKPAAKPVAKPVARPAAKPVPKPVARPAAPAHAAAPAPVAPPPAPAAPVAKTKAAPGAGPFGVGTGVLNVGLGLGSRYSYGSGLFGGSSSGTPAFSLSYERGLVAVGPGYIGVGGLVGYQYATYTFDFLGASDKWRYHDVVVMARGAFHYPATPQLDAYAGLGLGVRYLRDSYDGGNGGGTSSNSVTLASGIYLGARYFFSPKLGGFAELGYDQSFFKIGLAVKM